MVCQSKIQRMERIIRYGQGLIMELDTNLAITLIAAITIAFAPISIIAIIKTLNFKG